MFITINAIDVEIPNTSKLVNKAQYDSGKKGLVNNTDDVGKRYLLLAGWSRRLITTQTIIGNKKDT